MSIMVWTYIVYLAISVALTVWVGYTLHKNGRVFLVDAFAGNETLADSVNHLLLVGFYLINIGCVSLFLQFGEKAATIEQTFEYLSMKLGVVLLVLGAMHFLNLSIFSKMRKKGADAEEYRQIRMRRHVADALPAND